MLGEALVVGFLASLVGLFCGFLIDKALVSLFDAIGFGLPRPACRSSRGR